ncbi:MAG: ribosome assembly RNA-binding protein YhbY [Clostridia bacterium]|nr:ribosome assembly RNA-binding protein YhbY [Clostridia bacterium]
MTLTSKQRAKLRGLASKEDTIFQLGKEGITENFIKAVDVALSARELIKFKVLENAMMDRRAAAEEIAEATNSIVVTVIGTKIVLYRPAEKPVIQL